MSRCRHTYVRTTPPRWRGWVRNSANLRAFGAYTWCRALGFYSEAIAEKMAIEAFDWPMFFRLGRHCSSLGLADCVAECVAK